LAVLIAHISDLHVSRFGEHVSNLRARGTHGRVAPRNQTWQPVEDLDGWRIEQRASALRLIDDQGAVHAHEREGAADPLKTRRAFAQRAQARLRTDHVRLARAFPSLEETERLLADDPGNTNLRFCRAAHHLRADRPDWVVITGDLTDDGDGYSLILAALAPFVERGRVLAIPGNHDIYDSPRFAVPAHARKRMSEKRILWEAFAPALGLPPGGVWVRELGDGVFACGLDSCVPPRTPMSASGEVDAAQLRALEGALGDLPREARKLALLHHHVVNLPMRSIGFSPWQLGMRLRNARTVFDFFRRLRFHAVLNGHRHVGYRYHPSHAPLFVSAPSTTLGCRSGAAPRPYYWRIELDGRLAPTVRERPL
jgi:3',5'-cyclic AMP phosphodiesterase CpdA